MNPHNVLLQVWQKVLKSKGEIRLVGRVSDPLIGNRSRKEVYLFVPDVHVLTPDANERFPNYRFNHQDSGLLVQLLTAAYRQSILWKREGGPKLVTTQLGDFFDVWREFKGTPDWTRVGDAHGELRDILYRGQFLRRACLKATMLLGNHDTLKGHWLPEITGLQLKMVNRTRDGLPFLFATHGDVFDLVEKLLPESVKAFFVHLFGSATPVSTYSLDDWAKAAEKTTPKPSKMKDSIAGIEHALECDAPRAGDARLPTRLAEEITDPCDSAQKSFEKYYEHLREASAESDTAAALRLIVTGHTHHARMTVCEPSDGRPPLVLMDVGAWIENCSYTADGARVTEPSAQLGVVHGNDARIYQVRYGE